MPGWQALHSSGSNCLVLPTINLSTVGSRTFLANPIQICNHLPDNVIATQSCHPSSLKHSFPVICVLWLMHALSSFLGHRQMRSNALPQPYLWVVVSTEISSCWCTCFYQLGKETNGRMAGWRHWRQECFHNGNHIGFENEFNSFIPLLSCSRHNNSHSSDGQIQIVI